MVESEVSLVLTLFSTKGVTEMLPPTDYSNHLGRTFLARKWWQRGELNSRPRAYESPALPLSYSAEVIGPEKSGLHGSSTLHPVKQSIE
jgi:hypothetical protein